MLNTTSAAVNLTGWAITDRAGGRRNLTGDLAAGAALPVPAAPVQLGNTGDTLTLLDTQGRIIDQVAYNANQVRPGRTICFGR